MPVLVAVGLPSHFERQILTPADRTAGVIGAGHEWIGGKDVARRGTSAHEPVPVVHRLRGNDAWNREPTNENGNRTSPRRRETTNSVPNESACAHRCPSMSGSLPRREATDGTRSRLQASGLRTITAWRDRYYSEL